MASENEASTQCERRVAKCQKGHAMVLQPAGSTSWMTQVICDLCRGSAAEVGGHWSCSSCNYDLCAICGQSPRCIKAHKLVRQGAGIGSWFSGMACDECKKSPWKSGAAWSCRKCDYDMCNDCIKEKLGLGKTAKASGPPAPEPSPDKAKSSESAQTPTTPNSRELDKEGKLPAVEEHQGRMETEAKTASAESEAPPPPPPPPPEPEVLLSETALMAKQKEEALARKRAIEERMAKDLAELKEEEERLNGIRKKINDADKIRLRSEALRSNIEQAKRDIQKLEEDVAYKREAKRKADEYAKQAAEAQVTSEGQLAAKREECQRLEHEMVHFLLHEAQERSMEEEEDVVQQHSENLLPQKDQQDTTSSVVNQVDSESYQSL